MTHRVVVRSESFSIVRNKAMHEKSIQLLEEKSDKLTALVVLLDLLRYSLPLQKFFMCLSKKRK